MVDISKAFSTYSRPLAGFFQEPGRAFYIPLYQREYSWDSENIEQLMEDICQGAENLLENSDEILFLGTIIRVAAQNPRLTLDPRDERAIPTRVDKIIDGQQRITTLALLSSATYHAIDIAARRLPTREPYTTFRNEVINNRLQHLRDFFSFDLQRGDPRHKPIIIRGSVDGWTLDGADQDNYKSHAAFYLARVIRAIGNDTTWPSFNIVSGSRVAANLRSLERWLEKVQLSHRQEAEGFPLASTILQKLTEETIWHYKRPELYTLVTLAQENAPERDALCSLVQMLGFSHFLMNCCCFTVIEPASDEWAFDMFQSLNATGTPLTALETFRPTVVNMADDDLRTSGGFKNSVFEQHMACVEDLFSKDNTAATKTKSTNEYLTALAHIHDGSKLARRFSAQRKWLDSKYSSLQNTQERILFIKSMAHLALYFARIRDFDYETNTMLAGLQGELGELATTCVLYLDDSNHAMAHTVLSLFYSLVQDGTAGAVSEFCSACKAIAAFYTLWRCALPNTGLDDAYRSILRGDRANGVHPLTWSSIETSLNSTNLKSQLRIKLAERGIGTKEDWMRLSQTSFTLQNSGNQLTRFVLLLTATNCIPDPNRPGLMQVGRDGSTENYLTCKVWQRKKDTSIEHIAPQKPPSDHQWLIDLYPSFINRIGNLTLLPQAVNTSAGNRNWKTKWIYYRHLAETDPTELAHIHELAVQNQLTLSDATHDLLEIAQHSPLMKTIITVDFNGSWDISLIEARSERICSIVWDKLWAWMN